MDIAQMATGMSQARLAGQVDMLMMKKTIDAQRQQGASVLQLLDAAKLGVNRQADPLALAATGLGGNLDLLA